MIAAGRRRKYSKIEAGWRDLQNSGEMTGLGLQKRERVAERVARRKRQLSDGACAQRVRRKDNSGAATVVTPM